VIAPMELENRAVLASDVRARIVRELGAALADAWRRQHVDRDQPDQETEKPSAVLGTPSTATCVERTTGSTKAAPYV
jgi:hypothetical protein